MSRAPRYPRDAQAARLTTRILRRLAEGPCTTRLLAGALGVAATKPFSITLARLKWRGVIAGDPQPLRGQPNIWRLTDKGAEDLAARLSPRVREKVAHGVRKVASGAASGPALEPRLARWCWWFVASGWSARETARLFGVRAKDVRAAVAAEDRRQALAEVLELGRLAAFDDAVRRIELVGGAAAALGVAFEALGAAARAA